MVQLKGNPVKIEGTFLKKGDTGIDFTLVGEDLKDISLSSYSGKQKVLVVVPSIDTEVCAQETVKINDLAKKFPETMFLVISKDTPFALSRFCKQKELTNIIPLSDSRAFSTFGKDYGVLISNGPLNGFLSRSIFLLDSDNTVSYSEQVEEISSMPDFDNLEHALK